MRIVALTTCHNRREFTLRALRTLIDQARPIDCELEICVVDDASSDGTADCIRDEFDRVIVLAGTGELYWAGGMRFGWDNYVRATNPDYLLVFNDDIVLYPNSLMTLFRVALALEAKNQFACAVSGALIDPISNRVAYGGAIRCSWWHPLRVKTIPPSGSILDCDMINMNFALLSRRALKLTGFLSEEFVHARADYDLSLRLVKLGGRVVLSPGVVGECNVNSAVGTSNQCGISFRERWRRLVGAKEQPPRERAIYYRRHGGLFWPFYWALPYVRTCLGAFWHYVAALPMVFRGSSKADDAEGR